MQDEAIWRVECIECCRTYEYKDNNNKPIDEPADFVPVEVTHGICPGCLEIALRPFISGLA